MRSPTRLKRFAAARPVTIVVSFALLATVLGVALVLRLIDARGPAVQADQRRLLEAYADKERGRQATADLHDFWLARR